MAGYVSEAVIRRLPGYYRHLSELEKEGVAQISSQELGERMRLTASQIRQDINCFGGFGRQGYGYVVKELRDNIGKILGLDKEHPMIILGAGNIGHAIANSNSFAKSGFLPIAIFDADPAKVGTRVGNLLVQDVAHIRSFLAENKVEIGVLAVPAEKAQALAQEVCQCGVPAIWNFAPLDLKLPKDIALVNVHLEEGLQVLSYRMLDLQGR